MSSTSPTSEHLAKALVACALLCLTWSTAVWGGAQLRAQPLIDALQGDWKGSGPPGEIDLRISGDTLRFFVREDFWYEATFTLTTTSRPAVLRATITDSPPPRRDIGAVVLAIVQVEAGQLSLAIDDGSDSVPESFALAMSRYDFRRVAGRILPQ